MKIMNQGADTGRKKVLFVITKSNWGGAQRYVYDLATNLDTTQFDVVVAFGSDGTSSGTGQLAKMLLEAKVRTVFVPELVRDVKASTDLAALKALIALFKSEKPDIVHLNSSKVGGLGALAGRIAKMQTIVFTAHGWPFWEDRNPIAKALIYLVSYATVLLSHHTICISAYDKHAVEWMPYVRRKIAIIRNGIGAIDFYSGEESRAKLFPADAIAKHVNDFWLLTNAELHPNKNLLFALDVVAQFNATHDKKIFYSIMGDGQQRAEIESAISRLNLDEQVHLLGFVADGRRYLKAFDGFFLPSKKEGVPYVILEAALAEIPIVASKVGGIPEVVENGRSGLLIDPNAKQEALEALSTLVENESARMSFAAQLYADVITKYSLKTMLKETVELYLTNI